MSELESRLRVEIDEWKAKTDKLREKDEKKSRNNLILSLVLGSSLLTAGLTQVVEVVGTQYQEDIERCGMALDFLSELDEGKLTFLTPEQRLTVLEEAVDMMDGNCHIPAEKEEG